MNVMIDSSHNKANRKVYLLKRIQPYISVEVANQIYKTCILPILDYADFLIDSGNVYNIGRLSINPDYTSVLHVGRFAWGILSHAISLILKRDVSFFQHASYDRLTTKM